MKKNGFTLIELMIAMAVGAILASTLLVLLNPLEQFARARDGNRKAQIAQIGIAIINYKNYNGTVPPAVSWLNTLQTTNELQGTFSNAFGSTTCATYQQNGFCYNSNGTDAIVYVPLEANLAKNLCSAKLPWSVWSSVDDRVGVVCVSSGTEPSVGSQTFVQ